MRLSLPRLLLLVLCLTLGQVLTLAHAAKHVQSPDDEATPCALCVHLHTLEALAVPPGIVFSHSGTHVFAGALLASVTPPVFARLASIRGPPFLSL